MKPVKVGICGFGTVGGGTFNVLVENAAEIARRAGRDIIIEQVGARRENPACDTSHTNMTADIFDVARNPDIDIVVELIGGYDVAKELVLEAIKHGKHVVTANKALIAVHGAEIFALDEVISGLESASKRQILKLMKKLAGSGKIVVMISHDKVVEKFATKILNL